MTDWFGVEGQREQTLSGRFESTKKDQADIRCQVFEQRQVCTVYDTQRMPNSLRGPGVSDAWPSKNPASF